MSFRWLDPKALVLLHDESLAIHGGASGVRDEGLLESALNRPAHLAAYGSPDVFDRAAAYAFGLGEKHPFIDGNKRVAFLAAGVFLRLNGWRLQVTQIDAIQTVLALAASEISETDFAAWLRAGSVEHKKP